MWIFILCGYSLLRAVLAWPILARYGINPAMFLVLDVATAYPLALGQVRIVSGFKAQDYANVQFWVGVASLSFITPYAYLFLAGHSHMPIYATATLGALVAAMAAASFLRVRQQCLGCRAAAAFELAAAEAA
jgi:hypothetical protein